MEIQIDWHRLKDWPLKKLLARCLSKCLTERFLWHKGFESVFLGLNLQCLFWFSWRGLNFFFFLVTLARVTCFPYPHAIYFRSLMLSCCLHQCLPWPLQITLPTTHSTNFCQAHLSILEGWILCHFIVQAALTASQA